MSARRADRLLDALVAGFAAWTLCAHAVVASGGGLRTLVWVGGPLALGACALAGWVGWSDGRRSHLDQRDHTPLRQGEAAPRPALRWAACAAAAACVGALAAGGGVVLFWTGAVLLACLLTFCEVRTGGALRPGEAGDAHWRPLLALGLLGAAVALVAHRPDGDDAFLLNLAVAAADRPDAAILARDTLHGLPGPPTGVPAGLPLYRFHSIELLEAALAWLTPMRVIDAAHVVVPALAGFLAPWVYARLFRLLAPGRWIWAVAAALAWLLCVGDTHLGYGNMAFVRLHQGKAILLTLGVPLLVATALEFSLSPSPARWLRLALLQVACIGLSATALWVAPVVAGVALLAGAPWRASGLRRLSLGVLASLYPVAVGAALLTETRGALGALAYRLDREDLPGYALRMVLGSGPAASAALWMLLAGWSLAPSALGRRVCALFPLAFLLVFWNPWLAPWIADHVTSEPAYWRVFWMLPLPVFVGVALSAPLGPPPLGGSPRLAAGVSALGAALLLALAPTQQTLSSGNRVRLGFPGPKVPAGAYAAAQSLARRVGPGAVVLAPRDVSTWLVTLHAHPYPLAARPEYVLSLRDALGPEEVARRVALTSLVGGGRVRPAAWQQLAAALTNGSLDAVCVAPDAARPELHRLLEEAGWSRVETAAEREIWMPGPSRIP